MTVRDVIRNSLSDVWITFTYADASMAPKPDVALSIEADVSEETVLSDALLSSEVHTIAARDGVLFVSVLEGDFLSLAERGVRE